MKLSLISTWTLAYIATVTNAQVNDTFLDCAIDSYYADLPADVADWDRDLLNTLIKESHRNVVQFTNSIDPGINDVWGALMDIDEGEEPGTIHLVYSDAEVPKEPFGQRGWVRDQMFPILRGVGVLGDDLTDIHNIRAATQLSDIVNGDKYFGECGVLTQPESCVSPAEGSADDTCACNRVFTPPATMKGDIARALMYMDLRYDGSDLFTLDLRLTDCPFQPERDMAYLSQMLTWHMEDPPSEREIVRNNRACSNWQGNRNPFVDYPELARQFWGEPLALPAIGERLIYEECEAIPTLAPTFAANQCELYEEGDFVIWLMNSDDPVSFGLYSFAPMEEGFELYLTDQPFDGQDFVPQNGTDQNGTEAIEGTIKFTAPAGGLRGGTLFGYGEDYFPFVDQFEEENGKIVPSQDGEGIFIYCLTAAGTPRTLSVFANGGQLAEAGLEVYNETESALPDGFPEEGVILLPHFDNVLYVGPGSDELTTEALRVAIRDPRNWEGSNDSRYGLESGAEGRRAIGVIAMAVVGLAGWLMV